MNECNHRIKEFKCLDNGYDIVCLKCGTIIKSEKNIPKELIDWAGVIFNLALSEYLLEISLKTLEEIDGLLKYEK